MFLRCALAGACAALLFALAACNQTTPATAASAPQRVSIDGSSTVQPLSQAVAAAFAQTSQTPVHVAESGTSGGLQKFCRGEIDIADASRPIRASEMVACYNNSIRYVEVPVAFDAITIIANPATRVRSVTIDELRHIWEPPAQATVMNWNDVNPAWPAADLKLFGPGTASGTFDYFTEAVMGERGVSRTDYTASEDDAIIVEGVASDPNALGYVGLVHYERNASRLAALAVDAGTGPVEASTENVKNGRYRPLSRPVLIYVSVGALERPEVNAFVEFYVTNAARLAAEVGYIPLPAAVYEGYLQRVKNRQAGTAFGGRSDMNATIEEVIARPLNEE